MPPTTVSENVQYHYSIFHTAKKVFLVGAGIVLVWLFYDRNKRETLYKALAWLKRMNSNKSKKKEENNQKRDVFWFDRRKSETTKRFSKTLQKKLTNAQSLFNLKHVDNTNAIKEEENKYIPIIAICLVTTDRLSSVLDFSLEGIEGTDYDRTLVIIIHPADEKESTVSSKMKAELTENYKNLKNVIDARFIPSVMWPDKIEGYHKQNVKEEVEKFLRNDTSP